MTSADITPPDDSGNDQSQKTYVYVISAATEICKIGVAMNVPKRLKALQTGHHQKLRVVHEVGFRSRREAYAIESRVHRLLKDRMIEGEWFAVSAGQAHSIIDRAISDLVSEREQAAIAARALATYKTPEWIEAPSWVRSPADAVSFVLSFPLVQKREFLVNLGDSVIFVSYRREQSTGELIYFANDVSRWHLTDHVQAA